MFKAHFHRLYLARTFGRNVDASGFFENQLDAGTWMTFDQSISGIRVQAIVTNFNGTWMHGSYIKVNGTVVASDHTLSPDGTDNRYDSQGRGVTTSAPKDPAANQYGVGFWMQRGHTIVVLNPADGSMRSGWPKCYDTYGDAGTPSCNNMATDLLSVASGDVVAIGTFDATSCNQNLRNALTYLFGDTDYTNTWSQVRISHMFLGKRNQYRPGLYLSNYSGYFGNGSPGVPDTPALVSTQWFDSHAGNLTTTVAGDNLAYLATTDIVSKQWIGYFGPPVTSSYTFYINSDDACYVWIGDKAISSYDHTNRDLFGRAGIGKQTSGAITLTAGQYYPIRIQWGNRVAGGELTVSWSNTVTAETTNFTGLLFYDTTGPGFTPSTPPIIHTAVQSASNNGSNGVHLDTGTYDAWVSTVPVGATVAATGIGTFTVTVIYTPTTPGNISANWWFALSPTPSGFPSGTTFTFSWTA